MPASLFKRPAVCRTLPGAIVLAALPAVAMAHAPCASLRGARIGGGVILGAGVQTEFKPDTGPARALPAFCRVTARIERRDGGHIGLEIWLPTQWNGRYLQAGNGGFAGSIAYAGLVAGVASGYAVANSDGGHQSSGGDMHWAVGRPDRLADFGHLALHDTAMMARDVIRAYYRRAPHHAYFAGCSDGGLEALMSLQRYPEQFDGWLVGAPENDFSGELATELLLTQRSRSAYATLTAGQLSRLSAQGLHDCGKDGLVADPASCTTDPAQLACTDPATPDCLSHDQIVAVTRLKTDDDTLPALGMTTGAERGPGQWSTWLSGGPAGKDRAIGWHESYAQPFFGDFIYGKPDLDLSTLDPIKALHDARARVGADADAVDADLARQRKAGKKVIQYHGWSDTGIPVQFSLRYYHAVQGRLGGDVRDFYRLFLIPGMGHCGGGPGAVSLGGYGDDSADPQPAHNLLAALVAWVEHGQAPASISGRVLAPSPVVQWARPITPVEPPVK